MYIYIKDTNTNERFPIIVDSLEEAIEKVKTWNREYGDHYILD